MTLSFLYVVAVLGSLCVDDVQAAAPWAMTWSSEQFGPDGPWQAVSVYIGSSTSQISLYPGAPWTSEILLSTLCLNTTAISSTCYAEKAGLFNPNTSTTFDDDSIELTPNGLWASLQYGYTNAVPIYARAHRALDSIDIGGAFVPSANLIAIAEGYQTYPNGRNYPLQVGMLSLGAPLINQSFTIQYGPPINGTMVPSNLFEQGIVPSYSYGMHIGSVSLAIPGSLYLGGYDQNRVLGEVSHQPINGPTLPIQLTDISVGVVDGGSPWDTSSVTSLLAQGNASLAAGLPVMVDPTNPYIYLPGTSCDAIAAQLPVTYNADLGLYIWDIESERYSQIVTSPSYLGFTFFKDGVNTADITIKVPFALLNLTLEAPLVTTPTQYFPCMGTDSQPALGRAFLQAAFLGVHWSKEVWFLAQAPGPVDSFIQDVVDIEPSTTTISASGSSWESTWTSFWTPLPSTNSSNSNADLSSTAVTSSGLSSGAKVGIGVGCGVAGLLAIALACWICLRRRRQRKQALYPGNAAATMPPQFDHSPPQMVLVEAADTKPNTLHELDYGRGVDYPPKSTQSSGYGRSTQYSSEQSQSSQHGPYELPIR